MPIPSDPPSLPVPRRSPVRRAVLFGLGWVFFALGAAGVVLPVLPTTPFMILALWAFSQSSARFHDWLYSHPTFGPRLQLWRRHRVIPTRVKLTAFAAMAASLVYLVWLAQARWYVIISAASAMAVGAIYIARCPGRVPTSDLEYSE